MVADRALRSPSHWVQAPGRVNLIGEHTDYTGGLVLPAAIDLEVRGIVSPRLDRTVRVASLAVDEEDTFRLGEEGPPGSGGWSDYVRGVTVALREAGMELDHGFELTLGSTLPVAAGLSSSAALEAAVALAALAVNGVRAGPERLAPICRRAEIEYVGVGCGLMDQMIVFGGRAGHAMMLDCRWRRLSYRFQTTWRSWSAIRKPIGHWRSRPTTSDWKSAAGVSKSSAGEIPRWGVCGMRRRPWWRSAAPSWDRSCTGGAAT